jgi:DNA invertase Pin-like site-specific DNA recombinase
MPSPVHVIYARKSTESEDRQVLSIESQIRELQDLAMRRGVVVAEVLTEAHSAKAPGRPVFGALMKRIHRDEIASVFCWKMDRLARNPLDSGHILQALADRKIEQVVTPERCYTADGNDRFLGTFELGMATKYIDDLRQNVTRGNRERFRRGWPNFRPPVGYLDDRATKTVVKDPERFDLMRRAWDLVLSGAMRPSQVLRVLNDQWRFRTRRTARRGGAPLSYNQFSELLSNPFYAGTIRLKSGETYRGAYQPMVTHEEFARVQQLLGRVRHNGRSRHEFAYSGLLTCANCGRTMVGEQHVKPSGKRYVYYRCHRRAADARCAEPTLPEAVFETQVAQDLELIRLPAGIARWLRGTLEQSLKAELAHLGASRDSGERALRDAKREEDNLLTLRLRGLVEDATFVERRNEILARQAAIREQLERPQSSPAELLKRFDTVMAFSQAAPEALKNGTPVQRRQIVQTVGSNWQIRGRVALYSAKKPFSSLRRTARTPVWWAITDEIRTWLLTGAALRPTEVRFQSPIARMP